MKKHFFILLILILLLTGTAAAVMKEIRPIKEIKPIKVVRGYKQTNITFYNTTVEILSADITIKQRNRTAKYDINYKNQRFEKNGWVKTVIKARNAIRLSPLKYRIGNQVHFFNMVYDKQNCRKVFYREANVLQEECDYIPKVKVEWKKPYINIYYKPNNFTDLTYDPIITDYTANNLTIRYDMNEGSGTSLIDSDRKSTRLNSSHIPLSRMPSSA